LGLFQNLQFLVDLILLLLELFQLLLVIFGFYLLQQDLLVGLFHLALGFVELG
jgi:hypothetical protein